MAIYRFVVLAIGLLVFQATQALVLQLVQRPTGVGQHHMLALYANELDEEQQQDLFEYFDPLMSPHAYPNGISPDSPKPTQQVSSSTVEQKLPSLARKERKFGFRLKEETEDNVEVATKEEQLVDANDIFDPRISPHAYSKGTSNGVVDGDLQSDKKRKLTSRRKVGVLLIDHGSRSEAANNRLEQMARLYQESVKDSGFVVQAAHMEIASPSIAEGIEALVQAGVEEIVCHPYFLSPGRHVKEDIPQLIAEATEFCEIPVEVTPPIGSQMSVMIDTINKLVQLSVSSKPR